jgi:hypothetical protein
MMRNYRYQFDLCPSRINIGGLRKKRGIKYNRNSVLGRQGAVNVMFAKGDFRQRRPGRLLLPREPGKIVKPTSGYD